MRDGIDQFFDEFKDRFRTLIRETVLEELEPFRDLLVHPAADDTPAVAELVDAAEIARLMGEDLSTERKKKAACQRVYDLARKGLIPSVRVSPRRVRFDPAAVKRAFAQGGLAKPYSPTLAAPAQQNACAAPRR
jgi:hypothetical protein